jgi:hypothetical protein
MDTRQTQKTLKTPSNKNPLHYNSITVLSFYLLPLLTKVAAIMLF